MDRLSPLDASFLHIEDGVSHMHIASAGIFEGPAPSRGEIADLVASKLHLVPRYRQVVRHVPLELGRPVWVDDPYFNLDYHVRHTALPRPGGEAELRNLVGRVMSQQLDRTRPLWEMWVVDNVAGDQWAMLSKTHHCMVDGVAGTDLLTVILDSAPDAKPPSGGEWLPQQPPSSAQLLGDAVIDRVTNPYEQLRALRAATRGVRETMARMSDVVRGLASGAGVLRPPPASTLNGPIGPHRRWAWARSSLQEVKAIRAALGGTVNDVVLAAITRGFRDLLASRGDDVPLVRTLVPVSVRTPGERGAYNNRVSGIIAELPVSIGDPVERLQSIRSQMDGLKESKMAVAGEVLTSLSGFAPPMLLALGTRLATRATGRFSVRNVNTVTTNVPGPQYPLYAAGRRMLEAFPYVPIGGSIRIGVAIFSYDGKLTFGVTGDWDGAPDIEILCAGIEDGMGELLKAAG